MSPNLICSTSRTQPSAVPVTTLEEGLRADPRPDRSLLVEWEAKRRLWSSRFGKVLCLDEEAGVPAFFPHSFPLSGSREACGRGSRSDSVA